MSWGWGVLFGFLLVHLVKFRSEDNRLIITVALLLTFCGICTLRSMSPLLGCMAIGIVYINRSGDEKLFRQINYFTPPILLLFFVRSGMCFQLSALLQPAGSIGSTSLLNVGLFYFVFRIAGKCCWRILRLYTDWKGQGGAELSWTSVDPSGECCYWTCPDGSRTIGGTEGAALHTIILASSVLYELIGPACAKLSLYLSHSYERIPEREERHKLLTEKKELSFESLSTH